MDDIMELYPWSYYLYLHDNIYKNIEEYNPKKKRKLLIVFDDMIADELNNKKHNPKNEKHNIQVKKQCFFIKDK